MSGILLRADRWVHPGTQAPRHEFLNLFLQCMMRAAKRQPNHAPTKHPAPSRTYSQVSERFVNCQHGNVSAQCLAAVYIHFCNHSAKALLSFEHQEAEVRPAVQEISAGTLGRA